MSPVVMKSHGGEFIYNSSYISLVQIGTHYFVKIYI